MFPFKGSYSLYNSLQSGADNNQPVPTALDNSACAQIPAVSPTCPTYTIISITTGLSITAKLWRSNNPFLRSSAEHSYQRQAKGKGNQQEQPKASGRSSSSCSSSGGGSSSGRPTRPASVAEPNGLHL